MQRPRLSQTVVTFDHKVGTLCSILYNNRRTLGEQARPPRVATESQAWDISWTLYSLSLDHGRGIFRETWSDIIFIGSMLEGAMPEPNAFFATLRMALTLTSIDFFLFSIFA
jgi:hypothetical protein